MKKKPREYLKVSAHLIKTSKEGVECLAHDDIEIPAPEEYVAEGVEEDASSNLTMGYSKLYARNWEEIFKARTPPEELN